MINVLLLSFVVSRDQRGHRQRPQRQRGLRGHPPSHQPDGGANNDPGIADNDDAGTDNDDNDCSNDGSNDDSCTNSGLIGFVRNHLFKRLNRLNPENSGFRLIYV